MNLVIFICEKCGKFEKAPLMNGCNRCKSTIWKLSFKDEIRKRAIGLCNAIEWR